MSRREKLSNEAKLDIIKRCLAGESKKGIAREYDLDRHTVQWMIRRYHAKDEITILNRVSSQKYTREFKANVVREYSAGEGSSTDLAIRYGITSRGIVSRWVIESIMVIEAHTEYVRQVASA